MVVSIKVNKDGSATIPLPGEICQHMKVGAGSVLKVEIGKTGITLKKINKLQTMYYNLFGGASLIRVEKVPAID